MGDHDNEFDTEDMTWLYGSYKDPDHEHDEYMAAIADGDV